MSQITDRVIPIGAWIGSLINSALDYAATVRVDKCFDKTRSRRFRAGSQTQAFPENLNVTSYSLDCAVIGRVALYVRLDFTKLSEPGQSDCSIF